RGRSPRRPRRYESLQVGPPVLERTSAPPSGDFLSLRTLPGVAFPSLEEVGEETGDLRAPSLRDRITDDGRELPHHVLRHPQLGERALNIGEAVQRQGAQEWSGSLRDVAESGHGARDGAELIRRQLVLRQTHHRPGSPDRLLGADAETRGERAHQRIARDAG